MIKICAVRLQNCWILYITKYVLHLHLKIMVLFLFCGWCRNFALPMLPTRVRRGRAMTSLVEFLKYAISTAFFFFFFLKDYVSMNSYFSEQVKVYQRNSFYVRRSILIPAGTWRKSNVASTSIQRHDVASTLRRRYIYVMCPLGCLLFPKIVFIPLMWKKYLPYL